MHERGTPLCTPAEAVSEQGRLEGPCALCRYTSLIRNSAPIGPYSRTMPRALWWSGGGLFLMSEAPLYMHTCCMNA